MDLDSHQPVESVPQAVLVILPKNIWCSDNGGRKQSLTCWYKSSCRCSAGSRCGDHRIKNKVNVVKLNVLKFYSGFSLHQASHTKFLPPVIAFFSPSAVTPSVKEDLLKIKLLILLSPSPARQQIPSPQEIQRHWNLLKLLIQPPRGGVNVMLFLPLTLSPHPTPSLLPLGALWKLVPGTILCSQKSTTEVVIFYFFNKSHEDSIALITYKLQFFL